MQDTTGLVETIEQYKKAEKLTKITGFGAVSLGAVAIFSFYASIYSAESTGYVHIDRVAAGKCLGERVEWQAKEAKKYPADEEIMFSTRTTGRQLQDCVEKKQEWAQAESVKSKNIFMGLLSGFLISGFAFSAATINSQRKNNKMNEALDDLCKTANKYSVSGVGNRPANL